ncbi:RnfABCDGE type electron transport complex subunit D [Natranaerobius thermophilus]|uniref:Electron transport complex, RnfABCDGE type, D subunit n=1 Tax=Natranaerobius thermophilus (strain ATCC BAA-1301 / DSM 18059 / JW/NM-WN-LF) TaxID=457570 RepID=B2A6C5_NATTJ|nr:RnfABCDGE type electron transport complex subunit D [Natranaerobius thermophilus]ACB84136.1 electron transport complex, RnfABCDGE type, D subunit [Natranaerobius thermophilus JW/NM-WN-LF]
MESNKTIVSPSPHLKADLSVSKSMRDVIIALIPIILVTLYFNGMQALSLIAVSVVTAAVTEVVFRKIMGKQPSLADLSAVLTGLFVALVLPVATSPIRAIIATVIAVGIAKELMGSLGWNRYNPALFGYVTTLLMGAWLPFMETGFQSLPALDSVSGATPLAMLTQGMEMPGYGSMLLGHGEAGSLAEASALAVIIGGLYLLYKKHINWRTPVGMIATVFIISLIFGVDPIYAVLGGGVLFGAFFMATDWVTCPINNKGKLVFGICVGLLICIFRYALPATGGVAFSILIMNGFTPMIEKFTQHPSFMEPRKTSEPASGGKTASS